LFNTHFYGILNVPLQQHSSIIISSFVEGLSYSEEDIIMLPIKFKFVEHPDKSVRFLEYTAILRIRYENKYGRLVEAHDDISRNWMSWSDHFFSKAKPEHKELHLKVVNKSIETLEQFYEALEALNKPKLRGKALTDAKKRICRKTFQQEALGSAFINNDALFSAANKEAFVLSEENATDENISRKIHELVMLHNEQKELTHEQMETLFNYIKNKIYEHQKLNRVEAAILDQDDKTLYFMYGKLRRKHIKGETFACPTNVARQLAKCSKSDVGKVMKKLEHLGAITKIQKGKAGAYSKQAAIYRFEC